MLSNAQIDAHVQKRLLPKLVNNVYVGNPILVKMIAKSQILFDSGKSIGGPILYGKKKGSSYVGIGKFDITPSTTRNLADWDWKSNYASITISGDDVDKIEGDAKHLALVSNEMEEGEETLRDNITTQMFGDGTGNESADMDGLENGIGTGAYGGITPSDLGSSTANPLWQSPVSATGGAITPARVKGFIGEATYGNKVTDLIFTTQTLYDALWAQVQPQQRFLDGKSALAKIGFPGIQIDTTQIIVDRHCPAGYMYGLNTDYWHFIVHKNKNFKWTPPKELIDGDAYVRQILLKSNFICVGRRYNWKAYNLTA